MPKYRNINIDGAYFGTTFPHLFLQSYNEAAVLPPKIYQYEPKIHGFKIYKKKGSKYYDGGNMSSKKKSWNDFEGEEKENSGAGKNLNREMSASPQPKKGNNKKKKTKNNSTLAPPNL